MPLQIGVHYIGQSSSPVWQPIHSCPTKCHSARRSDQIGHKETLILSKVIKMDTEETLILSKEIISKVVKLDTKEKINCIKSNHFKVIKMDTKETLIISKVIKMDTKETLIISKVIKLDTQKRSIVSKVIISK